MLWRLSKNVDRCCHACMSIFCRRPDHVWEARAGNDAKQCQGAPRYVLEHRKSRECKSEAVPPLAHSKRPRCPLCLGQCDANLSSACIKTLFLELFSDRPLAQSKVSASPALFSSCRGSPSCRGNWGPPLQVGEMALQASCSLADQLSTLNVMTRFSIGPSAHSSPRLSGHLHTHHLAPCIAC